MGGAALQEKLPASLCLCLPAPGAARPKRSPVPSVSEEEISNMRSELEKYGIQMPAFGKIGGILANELSLDEAACKRKSGPLSSYWRGFQIRDWATDALCVLQYQNGRIFGPEKRSGSSGQASLQGESPAFGTVLRSRAFLTFSPLQCTQP